MVRSARNIAQTKQGRLEKHDAREAASTRVATKTIATTTTAFATIAHTTPSTTNAAPS